MDFLINDVQASVPSAAYVAGYAAAVIRNAVYSKESDVQADKTVPELNQTVQAAAQNQPDTDRMNVQSSAPASGKAKTGAKGVTGAQPPVFEAKKNSSKAACLDGKCPDSRPVYDIPECLIQKQEEPRKAEFPHSPNDAINAWWEDIQKLRTIPYDFKPERKEKIFIRLGHDVFQNGRFSGAFHEELSEKQVIDEVGFSLAEVLFIMGYDIKVYRSYDGDECKAGLAANHGIDAAKAWEADLFISCHANAGSPTANGTEILYNGKGHSKAYAERLADVITTALGTKKRREGTGIFGGSTVNEMIKTPMPAVLLEPLFISSESDRKKYKEYTGKALGRRIAECADRFLNELPVI